MHPAKIITALFIFLCAVASTNARAQDNKALLQMATCEESWLDFRQDPVKVQKYSGLFQAQFREGGRDSSMVPIKPTQLLGLKISRVYPQSVGMGLGFSVIVDAGFDATKAGMEKQMGKSFEHCASEEGSKSCELSIADKKTVVLMEGARGKKPQTLLGCYYYYEK